MDLERYFIILGSVEVQREDLTMHRLSDNSMDKIYGRAGGIKGQGGTLTSTFRERFSSHYETPQSFEEGSRLRADKET